MVDVSVGSGGASWEDMHEKKYTYALTKVEERDGAGEQFVAMPFPEHATTTLIIQCSAVHRTVHRTVLYQIYYGSMVVHTGVLACVPVVRLTYVCIVE